MNVKLDEAERNALLKIGQGGGDKVAGRGIRASVGERLRDKGLVVQYGSASGRAYYTLTPAGRDLYGSELLPVTAAEVAAEFDDTPDPDWQLIGDPEADLRNRFDAARKVCVAYSAEIVKLSAERDALEAKCKGLTRALAAVLPRQAKASDGTSVCLYCLQIALPGKPIKHAEHCPMVLAADALREGGA